MKRSKQPAPNGHKLTASIHVVCSKELKRRGDAKASELGIPLSELTAQALAAFLDCPQLGYIPRKPPGRPRKPIPA
jgi:hypothetical protein